MKFKKGKYFNVDCAFVNSDYSKYIIKDEDFISDSDNKDLIRDIEYQLDTRDKTRNHFYYDKIDLPKQKIWNKEHGMVENG